MTNIKTIGVYLGIIAAGIAAGSALFGLGAKVAASDFVTINAAKAREQEVVGQLQTRISSGEALASQREAALAQRIEELGKSTKEANDRMTAAIDRIYQLLLQGRR